MGGNAEAYLNGNVHVILDMIVKPSRNVGGSLFDVEIKDTSSVDFKVYMKGNPLKFDLSVSGGGLSASLLKVVSTNDKPSYLNMMAHMKLDFNLKDASKSTPEEIKAAKDAKDASWQIYQNKLKTAVVTTDDLYTKLTDARTKPVNTSFAKDGNGAIVVEFSGNKTWFRWCQCHHRCRGM